MKTAIILFLLSIVIVTCSTTKQVQTKQVQLLSWKFKDRNNAWLTVLDNRDTLKVLYYWPGKKPQFTPGMCFTIKVQ
jgi:hypothetical protein